MDLQECLSILNKKKGWFLNRSDTQERLDALDRIAAIGGVGVIPFLIPYLKDEKIILAVSKAISALFSRITAKNSLYSSMSQSDISVSDLNLFQKKLEPDQYLDLVLIASMNRNGYVREAALTKLGESISAKAIPFVTYRFADWVPEVRQEAFKTFQKLVSNLDIDALVNSLEIFDWLRKVERVDLSSEYASILDHIRVKNRKTVLAKYRSYHAKNRFLLAKHLSETDHLDRSELELFLNDRNFQIRALAVDHIDLLTKSDVRKLLSDRSSYIRLRTLYGLKDRDEFPSLIREHLADPAASIRYLARFSLRDESIDLAKFYHDALDRQRSVIGALAGLAEVDAKEYSEGVGKFLTDPRPGVRKAAFLALTRLNEHLAYDFAMSNLDSSFVSLRKLAMRFLEKRPTSKVLMRAREVYATGDVTLKKQILSMFDHIGGWKIIPDIILGTIDEEPDIRELSKEYLSLWRSRSARIFTKPPPDELEQARHAYESAFRIHEKENYFDVNPLQNFDFHLK